MLKASVLPMGRMVKRLGQHVASISFTMPLPLLSSCRVVWQSQGQLKLCLHLLDRRCGQSKLDGAARSIQFLHQPQFCRSPSLLLLVPSPRQQQQPRHLRLHLRIPSTVLVVLLYGTSGSTPECPRDQASPRIFLCPDRFATGIARRHPAASDLFHGLDCGQVIVDNNCFESLLRPLC